MYSKAYVEITNICNLDCSFCPKNSRPKRFMTVEEFDSITEQIAPLTNTICLHLMGEPLLHPSISEIFAICNQKGLKVHLTTNGTLSLVNAYYRITNRKLAKQIYDLMIWLALVSDINER